MPCAAPVPAVPIPSLPTADTPSTFAPVPLRRLCSHAPPRLSYSMLRRHSRTPAGAAPAGISPLAASTFQTHDQRVTHFLAWPVFWRETAGDGGT